MKVFGIGMPRTGTTTLLHACRILGYRGKDYNAFRFYTDTKVNKERAQRELRKFITHHNVFQDNPFQMIYPWLYKNYQRKGRFILTIRKDPETFYQSLYNNAQAKKDQAHIKLIRTVVYGHEMPTEKNKEKFINKYEEHNRKVMDFFAGNDRFAVMCWENGDGWEKLCDFLKKPIPNIPFPHQNKSKC